MQGRRNPASQEDPRGCAEEGSRNVANWMLRHPHHHARRSRLPFVRVCRSTPHARCAAPFSAVSSRWATKPRRLIARADQAGAGRASRGSGRLAGHNLVDLLRGDRAAGARFQFPRDKPCVSGRSIALWTGAATHLAAVGLGLGFRCIPSAFELLPDKLSGALDR